MGIRGHLLVGVLVFVHAVSCIEAFQPSHAGASINPSSEALSPSFGIGSLNRSSFPKGFVFGAASSAYQIEGAWNEDGRGPSVWDNFAHKYPEKIRDHSNGDVACDSYHRYKEDVQIMKGMGLDAYRFSMSWSRILPKGKLSGGVNKEGIKYYNNLINEVIANGLEPYVTLFHWDTPLSLEDEYGGFLSPRIVTDFRDYAKVCYDEFGDRVKYWITLNEPWSYSYAGYALGANAPGRCSSWQQMNCTGGDSGTEPYLVTHHQLLAHAMAVNLYKQNYQRSQKGKIGITLNTIWMVPYSNSELDQRASLRALDFNFGWFIDPLTMGDYPPVMRSLVGKRIPKFTIEESKLLKGSLDFLGINYYTALYASHATVSAANTVNASFLTDSQANLAADRNGVLIGEQVGGIGLHVYPRGIRDLLLYIKRKYNNPLVYITENGIDEVDNGSLSMKEAIMDSFRIKYYYDHLDFLRLAIKGGVNVMAYFAWSILDNYEWSVGYTDRFGLTYVNFKNGLKRYPKLSAKWFKVFLQK